MRARALFNHWRHPAQRSWEWGVELPAHVTDYWLQGARSCLSAIESAGLVIVEREVFNDAREFVKDISEDQYTDGVPWRQAEQLLKKLIAASPKHL